MNKCQLYLVESVLQQGYDLLSVIQIDLGVDIRHIVQRTKTL